MRTVSLCLVVAAVAMSHAQGAEPSTMRLATFDVDVTPPVGTMMAYDRVVRQGAHAFGRGLASAAAPWFLLGGIAGFGVGGVAMFLSLTRLGSNLSTLIVQCLSAVAAATIEYAISRPFRPWHDQRRFSRPARGLAPYRRPEKPAAPAEVSPGLPSSEPAADSPAGSVEPPAAQ